MELYPLAVKLDGANLEVDADSGDKRWSPGIIAKPEQKTALTHAWVSLVSSDPVFGDI